MRQSSASMASKLKKQKKSPEPDEEKKPSKPRVLAEWKSSPYEDYIAQRLRMVLLMLSIPTHEARPFYRLMSLAIKKYFLNVPQIEQSFLRICYSLAASSKFVYDYYMALDIPIESMRRNLSRTSFIFESVFNIFGRKFEKIVENFLKLFGNLLQYFMDKTTLKKPQSIEDDTTMDHFESPIEQFRCDIQRYQLTWKAEVSVLGILGTLTYSEEIFQQLQHPDDDFIRENLDEDTIHPLVYDQRDDVDHEKV